MATIITPSRRLFCRAPVSYVPIDIIFNQAARIISSAPENSQDSCHECHCSLFDNCHAFLSEKLAATSLEVERQASKWKRQASKWIKSPTLIPTSTFNGSLTLPKTDSNTAVIPESVADSNTAVTHVVNHHLEGIRDGYFESIRANCLEGTTATSKASSEIATLP